MTPTHAQLREFYNSPAWRRLRAWAQQQFPLCAYCEREGRTGATQHIDHKQRVRDAWDRRLDPDNLQGLCATHHNSTKKREERTGTEFGCDERGLPLAASHHWNR